MVASRIRIQAKVFMLVGTFLVGSLASAAGYEKNIMWGGKSAGLAGIGSPYAQGGEALYFNPAGLQKDKVGNDVSFFISPSWNSSKGPFNNSNTEISSESKMITPVSLLYGYTPNSTWGFGAGFYVAGGSAISFKDVAYTTPAPGSFVLSPSKIQSDLQLFEFSLGAGYKVNDSLKLGVAWRADIAKASFTFAQRASSGNALVNAEVNDVKANSYHGFRLGAQYKLSDETNLSLSYRSPVFIRGKGKIGGTLRSPGTNTPIAENDVTAATIFPQQVNIGGMHKLNDTWTLFGEYAWTNYSIVDHVTLEGNLLGSDVPDLQQNWHDQHNIKLAAAYTGFAMPIYFGAQWISQVTAKDLARVSDVAPGPGWGVTLGTEYQAKENLKFTAAAEYGLLKGDSTGAAAGDASSDFRAGSFTSVSSALHLGVQYAF